MARARDRQFAKALSPVRPQKTFSPEEAGFLHAIHESPFDRTTRLVYADWLEERKRTEAAELIRGCIFVESSTDKKVIRKWNKAIENAEVILKLQSLKHFGLWEASWELGMPQFYVELKTKDWLEELDFLMDRLSLDESAALSLRHIDIDQIPSVMPHRCLGQGNRI